MVTYMHTQPQNLWFTCNLIFLNPTILLSGLEYILIGRAALAVVKNQHKLEKQAMTALNISRSKVQAQNPSSPGNFWLWLKKKKIFSVT